MDLNSLQQSILSLESFARTVKIGWSNFKTLSHFLTFINVAFVLTSVEIFRRARGPLFLLAIFESTLEYLAYWCYESGKMEEEERVELQLTARQWALLITVMIFIDSLRSFLLEKFRWLRWPRRKRNCQHQNLEEEEEGEFMSAREREVEGDVEDNNLQRDKEGGEEQQQCLRNDDNNRTRLTAVDLQEVEQIVSRAMARSSR